MSRSSLIAEYTREAENPDYTIDAVIVLEDDLAYAIGYDAATSDFVLLEGKRGAEGICFAPTATAYPHFGDALNGVKLASEGVEIPRVLVGAAV
jgi:hypothetical protein